MIECLVPDRKTKDFRWRGVAVCEVLFICGIKDCRRVRFIIDSLREFGREVIGWVANVDNCLEGGQVRGDIGAVSTESDL